VRTIHNEKEGAWGKTPAVRLELIRTLGGNQPKDPNLAFGSPYDIVIDSQGYIYVLDERNTRIQKISPEGLFLQSIGRDGQGPGDFQAPFYMDVDDADRLYVLDYENRKIQVMTPEGKAERQIRLGSSSMVQVRLLKSGEIVLGGLVNLRDLMGFRKKLPPLLSVIDSKGKTQRTFGEMRDYRDINVNAWANWIDLDIDENEYVCVSFRYQNRVEKYSSAGVLEWKADRILNYRTEVIDKGFVHRDYNGIAVQMPTLNAVSQGIAVDKTSRIWVLTVNRQMTREETGEEISVPGKLRKTTVEPIVQKMDIYKIEVFGPDGILLGSIPLDHLAHGIRICGDDLLIWERTAPTVYQYRIRGN
jgi:sugar lactone lactonase YvrE